MDAFEIPMWIEVVDDEVVILGPQGLAAAFTAEAAEESGRRLTEAALKARRHRDAKPNPPG